MRRIVKGPEPACLRAVRLDAAREERESGKPPVSSDWSLLRDCTQPTRDALTRDQGFLCAYCNRRIPATAHHDGTNPHGMRIEHFVPRSVDPRLMFDWANLLGACSGQSVVAGVIHDSCDRHRGNTLLHVHPARRPPDAETVFSYNANGTITSSDANAAQDIATLNLNAEPLRKARVAAVDAIRQKLIHDDREASLRALLHRANNPDTTGALPPHASVVAAYLRKKLIAHGHAP